jgi:hypothetical protein
LSDGIGISQKLGRGKYQIGSLWILVGSICHVRRRSHRVVESKMTMREEVKRVMGEKNMTAYRLSELSGINQGLLSRYFARKSELSVKSLEKLLDVLGCELTVRGKK